jgi:hypothetical protein
VLYAELAARVITLWHISAAGIEAALGYGPDL